MQTNTQRTKQVGWKYILVLAVVLGGSFLIARAIAGEDSAASGYESEYKGNKFEWRNTDTLFYDRKLAHTELASAHRRPRRQLIFRMNGEPVYQNEYLHRPASWMGDDKAYIRHIELEFSQLCKGTPDSSARAFLNSLVVDKAGKIVYYQVRFGRPFFENYGDKYLYPFGRPEPVLNSYIEKIIKEGPLWKPATVDGKHVNSLVTVVVNEGC